MFLERFEWVYHESYICDDVTGNWNSVGSTSPALPVASASLHENTVVHYGSNGSLRIAGIGGFVEQAGVGL